ncbi:peroxiredoxin family protein [Aquisphaera insulae]|uniref:peroxiredoxin family protein n=1 Tax=Aquisphaera insulae TaxID=2712864 RepID=UPI0013E9C183|nr:peroxiredoxin family protein [Aquisphaera insulae]
MIRRLSLSSSLGILSGLICVGVASADAPKVGDAAPDFTLKTPGGETVRLATLREKGPVVLVVLRGWPGYQCPICTQQVGELIGKASELAEAGAQTVLVYPGPAQGLEEHASEFSRGKTLPDNFHFVVDPDYDLTKAYDLRWNAPRETAYPSTFVVGKDGRIAFAKISHSHGDRARAGDVLEALGRLKK